MIHFLTYQAISFDAESFWFWSKIYFGITSTQTMLYHQSSQKNPFVTFQNSCIKDEFAKRSQSCAIVYLMLLHYTSRLEAHAGFFRLLMMGIFYPYVL